MSESLTISEWTIYVCPNCGRQADGLTYCWDCDSEDGVKYEPIQVIPKPEESSP